jgi:hypothetical protein
MHTHHHAASMCYAVVMDTTTTTEQSEPNISTRDEWRQCGTHSVIGMPYKGPWYEGTPSLNKLYDAKRSLRSAQKRHKGECPKVWIETRTVVEIVTGVIREAITA